MNDAANALLSACVKRAGFGRQPRGIGRPGETPAFSFLAFSFLAFSFLAFSFSKLRRPGLPQRFSAITERFGDMDSADFLNAIEISQRPRNFERAMETARG